MSFVRTTSRVAVASAFTPAPFITRLSTSPPSIAARPPLPSKNGRPFSHRSSDESIYFISSARSQITALCSTTEEEIDPGVIEGTDLVVLKYPHPSLRAPNAEILVEELTGPGSEISRIAKEMFLVMYATNGVGLAAPQVGINKRLMVYNESGDRKKWMQEVVMVNPKIVEFSTAKDVENEGCLSFPDMRGDVERSKWIKVEALNLKGKKIKKKFTGWEARIFQHEYDHLDGVVYVDRLTEEGRKEVQPKLDELVAKFGEGGAL
jgi:peptide deformylase